MTKREKRLIAVLGAHTRLRETRARRHDPRIADALVLHLRRVIRELTAKECLLIHEASSDARDAAYDQAIAWSQRPPRKPTRGTSSLPHI